MKKLIAYVFVLIAVGMDLKSMKISNRLILIGLGISLVRRFICGGISEVFTGIILISFPVILLYFLFLVGAIGAGDIKLFSLIGGFVNFKELLWCIGFSFLFGAILSLLKMLFCGTLFSSMERVACYVKRLFAGEGRSYPYQNEQQCIHFSVAILLGLIVAKYFG